MTCAGAFGVVLTLGFATSASAAGDERIVGEASSCRSNEVSAVSVTGTGYSGSVSAEVVQEGVVIASANGVALQDGSVALVVPVDPGDVSDPRYGDLDVSLTDSDGGDEVLDTRYNCRDSGDTAAVVTSVTADCPQGHIRTVTVSGVGADRGQIIFGDLSDTSGTEFSEEPSDGTVGALGDFSITLSAPTGPGVTEARYFIGYSPVAQLAVGSIACPATSSSSPATSTSASSSSSSASSSSASSSSAAATATATATTTSAAGGVPITTATTDRPVVPGAGAGARPVAGALAATGADVGWLAPLGLLASALGALALYFGRAARADS